MDSNDLKDFFEQAFDISSEKTTELINSVKESDFLDMTDELVSLIRGVKVISSVNKWFFVKKVKTFSRQLKSHNTELFKYNWEKTKPKQKGKIILQLLIQLERTNTESKVCIYAETIRAKIEDRLKPEQFDCIWYSVGLTHPMGFEVLKIYYDYSKKLETLIDNDIERNKIYAERASLDFSSLVTSGFLKLPSGGAFFGDLGGAIINELGIVFFEQVLSYIGTDGK